MVRSLILLSVIPALVAAQDFGVSSGSLEDFPTIVPDSSPVAAPTTSVAPVNPYPTSTVTATYPGSETGAPTEGTPTETVTATGVPYPSGSAPVPTGSGSATGTEAPVPTDTSAPGYGAPSGSSAGTEAPVPTTVATSYAPPAATSGEGPVVTTPSNNTAAAIGVKLPVVLGAMAVGFAML